MGKLCYYKEIIVDERLNMDTCESCVYRGLCVQEELLINKNLVVDPEVTSESELPIHNKEGFQLKFEEDDIRLAREGLLEDEDEESDGIDYLSYEEDDVIGLSDLDDDEYDEEDNQNLVDSGDPIVAETVAQLKKTKDKVKPKSPSKPKQQKQSKEERLKSILDNIKL